MPPRFPGRSRLRRAVFLLLAACALTCRPARAQRQPQLVLGKDASLDIGLMLQTHTFVAHETLGSGGDRDLHPRMFLRRARLRFTAQATRWVTVLLQTDRGDGDGRLGVEFRLIDAYAILNVHPMLRLFSGIHMAPASRQNLTLSASLVAFDRPAQAFKTLTWGTRALAQFANRTVASTDAGFRNATPVRDVGWTTFGTTDLAPKVHFKYYAGLYEGIPLAGHRTFRTTARVQLNLLDGERDYFNASTYQGGRRTVALGLALDRQAKVAHDQGRILGYRHATADLFVEHPAGPGSLSAELGASALDLGGGRQVSTTLDPEAPRRDVRKAEGVGHYAQVAYWLGGVQPWAGHERWYARDGAGSFKAVRFGVTRYLAGQNANLKLGYEHFWGGSPLGRGAERTWSTVAFGIFVFY